ncbi:MAG: bacillithiol biosynthesis cysteine-adding enzyme BshC [Thermoanaerobaculia bacterium]
MKILDLATAGRLSGLPGAVLSGRDRELLAPLELAVEDELPACSRARARDGALARALADTNAAYGHPRAEELSRAFADPATVVVVGGQQPGLFGGPLYTLSKAAAVVLAAERISAAGKPAVPLFWVASEDHDFTESSRAVFLSPRGPFAVDLGNDPAPLTPVGMRPLGPAVVAALETLKERIPGDRAAAWIDTLAGWYRPESRFGEAFSRLLVYLMGERAPLLVDSMLPELKAAQRPWLERLVGRRQEVAAALAARETAIERAGHELQVKPQAEAAPLFWIRDGERRRIEWAEGGYRLRGLAEVEPLERLTGTLEENPEAISPGVQARPLIQDAVLGSALAVLGPGELAYMPQVAPLYELLEVPPPRLLLRPQALFVEARHLDWREEMELEWGELTGSSFDVESWLAARADGDPVPSLGAEVDRLLAGLERPLAGLDPNLRGPLEKTRQHVERGLATLSGKVRGALARQDEVLLGRLRQLRELCFPDAAPQERVLSTAHFPAKHGRAVAEALLDQLGLAPGSLNLVVLEDG